MALLISRCQISPYIKCIHPGGEMVLIAVDWGSESVKPRTNAVDLDNKRGKFL
jgi:hypothetical protein